MPIRFGASCWPNGLVFPVHTPTWSNCSGPRPNPTWQVRWSSCPSDFRNAAKAWITETAGDAASVVLGCVEAEHGPKALAIGLVMGVVYHETIGHELDKAAGRLEAYVGTTNLPTETAKRWRDAAIVAAAQLSKPALRCCLDEAEVILGNVAAVSQAWRSNELESGFEQRLTRFGQALAAHIDARATAISEELQNVYGSLQQHRLGRAAGRRMERVAMALRLARWLTDQNTGIRTTPASMVAIASGYAAEGGYVDWGRRVLRGGEPNKDLAAAFVRLVDRVTELREAENFKFAQAVAAERASSDAASGLIPVEQAVELIVAKAAEIAPVLLLLVDGMSWAVFRELVADIKSHDWIELGFAPSPKRLIGLAALPSVTEVCRASLFCGSLRRGQATDEGKASRPTQRTSRCRSRGLRRGFSTRRPWKATMTRASPRKSETPWPTRNNASLGSSSMPWMTTWTRETRPTPSGRCSISACSSRYWPRLGTQAGLSFC